MKRSEAFESKYLGKEDVGTPLVATIERVQFEEIHNDEGGKDRKPVARFGGDTKGLILNLTNWGVLEDAYGEDSDDWIGKPVEVYFDGTVMFKGKRTGGVRVRIPVGGNGHAAAPASKPNMGVPMGDLAARKLNTRMATLAADGKPMATFDQLRTSLVARHPSLESVIAGNPATWPASLMPDIAGWLKEIETAAAINDDDIPF